MTWSKEINEWQRDTFGEPTPEAAYDRFDEELREFDELSIDEDDAEEAADVVITLVAYLASKGKDLATEIEKKMAINRKRKWKTRGDGTGQHE